MTALPSLTGRASSVSRVSSETADAIAKQALADADDALEAARFATAKYRTWNVLFEGWEDGEEYLELTLKQIEANEAYEEFARVEDELRETDPEYKTDFDQRAVLLAEMTEVSEALGDFQFPGSQTRYFLMYDHEPDELESLEEPFEVDRVEHGFQVLWRNTDDNFDALAYQLAVLGHDPEEFRTRFSWFTETGRRPKLPPWFNDRVTKYQQQLEGATHE